MSEKKEKQWGVVRMTMGGRLVSIIWFDARKQARDWMDDRKQAQSKRYYYRLLPMTRGPGA